MVLSLHAAARLGGLAALVTGAATALGGCGGDGSPLGGSVSIRLVDLRGALGDPSDHAVTSDEVVHLRIAEYASDHHHLRLSGEDLGELVVESVEDRRCRAGSASVGSICVGLGGSRRVGDAHVTLLPLRDGDATVEVVSDDGVVVASAPLRVRHVATLGGSIRFGARDGAPPTEVFGGRTLFVVVRTREPLTLTFEPRSFDGLDFFFHTPLSDLPLPAGLAGGWEGPVLRVTPIGPPSADRTIQVGDARVGLFAPVEGLFEPSSADGGGAALAR